MKNLFSFPVPSVRRGGFGDIVGWFIRVIIYDMIVTGIVSVFGVSRMTALFIFLGILVVVGIGGYLLRRKMGGQADSSI